MLKVGLTGGLASGKSFAAAEFERLGCAVLQADALGREILRDDEQARREVASAFGASLLVPEGGIDRKALAAQVFGDPEKLARLNAIVHPRVFARIDRFFAELRARKPAAVAMVEAAIMIESGSYRRYDRLVLAECPREVQIERFTQRDGGSRQEAETRLARQMPAEAKRRYADFRIDTGGSRAETLRQVGEVYRRLRTEADAAPGERLP